VLIQLLFQELEIAGKKLERHYEESCLPFYCRFRCCWRSIMEGERGEDLSLLPIFVRKKIPIETEKTALKE
jgi:hypothetical protein